MKKKRSVTNREELDRANESTKLKMAREYARLQNIRSSQSGESTRPKVSLPRFSWDKEKK